MFLHWQSGHVIDNLATEADHEQCEMKDNNNSFASLKHFLQAFPQKTWQTLVEHRQRHLVSAFLTQGKLLLKGYITCY